MITEIINIEDLINYCMAIKPSRVGKFECKVSYKKKWEFEGYISDRGYHAREIKVTGTASSIAFHYVVEFKTL